MIAPGAGQPSAPETSHAAQHTHPGHPYPGQPHPGHALPTPPKPSRRRFIVGTSIGAAVLAVAGVAGLIVAVRGLIPAATPATAETYLQALLPDEPGFGSGWEALQDTMDLAEAETRNNLARYDLRVKYGVEEVASRTWTNGTSEV